MTSASSSIMAWDRFFIKYGSDAGSKGPRKAQSMRDLKSSSIISKRVDGKTEADWEDCTNKLRTLILIEGVPQDGVRTSRLLRYCCADEVYSTDCLLQKHPLDLLYGSCS